MQFIKYLILGTLFGILLTKSEVISWYRIQEMFRFQSFHMYGIIGSAVVTGAISLALMKYFRLKTFFGEEINYPEKKFHHGVWIGGILFGAGWALTGACPGPLFALLGKGVWVISVVILSAVAGTYVYGLLRHKLPH